MITNENVLMISQDAKIKNERYLTMSASVDMESLAA